MSSSFVRFDKVVKKRLFLEDFIDPRGKNKSPWVIFELFKLVSQSENLSCYFDKS